MRKKEDFEKRITETASISLKKTIPFGIEDYLRHHIKNLGLRGWTRLNKEFMMFKTKKSEKEFDDFVWNSILKEMNINQREYSKEIRKWLAEKKILPNLEKKSDIKECQEYLENEEYNK